MSDKSFGDHTNRNIVKNPLLSSAVTGLSLEDLTHKAVLLPATPTQGQVTRQDTQQGTQSRALGNADDDKPGFPSGDAFSNIPLSNTPSNSIPNVVDRQNNEKNRGAVSGTQSKASVKSEDDFDVNEYIARLQGTRYVSAPLHSHKKEDQNVNLEAEESLEEINLNESGANEPVEVQQSLTADIAQNFSQLPTVLPHVASAVFSSFSNMLNMNKSREQTPDDAKVSGYQEVQFERSDVGVHLMGVEESAPKDIGLPPKEPPMSSINSYRITSKKKYAQIPGLSSGGANVPYSAQNVTYDAPIQQIIPPLFTPADVSSTTNVTGTTETMDGDNLTASQNIPPMFAPADDKMESKANMTCNTDISIQQVPDNGSYSMFNRSNNNIYGVQTSTRLTTNIGNTEEEHTYVSFNIDKSENVQAHENHPLFAPPEGQPKLFTPIETKQDSSHSIQPGPPIIPPPPMFSNIPRKDSQASVNKSVLPPSVARRISANQPLIKPQAIPTPSFTENIFVPSVIPETANQKSVPEEMLPPKLPPSITPKLDQTVKPPVASPPQSRLSEPDYSTGLFYTPPKQEVSQLAFEIVGRPNITIPVSQSPLQTPSIPLASQFGLNTSLSTSSPAVTISSTSITAASNVATPPSFVSMFNSNLQNMPLPSTSSNPSQGQSTQMQMPHTITPDINPEPAKPIIEPPKATGNLNFRMTKKRPQYYSGPIEGVGNISNYVKPTIQPVMPPLPTVEANNKAALFSPDQQSQKAPNNDQAYIPFDISRPVMAVQPPVEPKQLYTHFETYQTEPNYVQEYNTAFDLSRPTTESFEPPKQESIGFGIIGSLKSKLSSIDINKIQSTVTTFFDPAYNESKVEPVHEAVPYELQQHGHYLQEQSNFEITVPGTGQRQDSQLEYQNMGYNYVQNDSHNPTQNTYNYTRHEVQNASSYFSDPNYVQQTYADSTLNKNIQGSTLNYYTQDDIPQNVENISSISKENQNITTFYNPAAFQEHNATEIDINNSQQSCEKPKENACSYDFAHVSTQNLAIHEAIGDVIAKASINQQIGVEEAYKHFIDPLDKSSSSLDNPQVTSEDSKIKAVDNVAVNTSKYLQAVKPHENISYNAPLAPAISFFDNPIFFTDESTTKNDDLVDNMKKLAMAEEIAIANSPFQAVDFAIGVITQPKAIDVSVVRSKVVGEISQPKAIDGSVLSKVFGEKVVGTTEHHNIVESNTDKLTEDMKGSSLMETLSKSDIPVVGVSSMPLFGLSALIADKSKEIANENKDHTVTLLEALKDNSRPPLEKQAPFSFFDNVTPDKKLHEESVKTALPHLNMTDVKNILLIEPPQENLGTMLKRSAGSSLLKDFPKADGKGEQNLSEDRDSSWNLDAAIVSSNDNVNVSYDRKGSGFFDHLIPLENRCEEIVQNENTETVEKASDFNICETCREVNVQEDKETDNVTFQLIENINSSIQLKNPVEAPLTESTSVPVGTFGNNQMTDDITQITENTFHTLQAQSATDLLDDVNKSSNKYGWTTEQLAYSSIAAIDSGFGIDINATGSSDYGFNVDKKSSNVMETLSKSDMPVVGLSSMPLFGLPARIADKSKEMANEEKDQTVTLLDAPKDKSRPNVEQQASFFFDDVTPDKNIHEESVKTALPHLNMTDVKNILLIEPPQDNLGTLLKQNASSSLLKHLPETDGNGKHNLSENRECSWNLDAAVVSSKDNFNVSYDRKESAFFDHFIPLENRCEEIVRNENTTIEKESNFNICETCREVNVQDDKETENVTTQLIENINSSIKLANPVEAPLTECDSAADGTFGNNQLTDDITQVTENTFDTLQAQSATDLLDDVIKSSNKYGWTTEQLAYSSTAAIDSGFGIDINATDSSNYGFNVENKLFKMADTEYSLKIDPDPDAIGFFRDSSLFFDNVPKNASDEIKAELKTSHDDIVLPRELSLPSAPPAEAEDDTKSDETGFLDVHSIEQDANKDFPLEEEFIIEPSETDDDKIEFRERKKSSEDSANDTFTDRIEKFKNKVGADSSENIFDKKSAQPYTNPPKSMASYFDTGNYAVETHYRNSLTSPTNINAFQQGSSLRIPPGFEDEFNRRFSGFSTGYSENKEPCIPETSTQTRTTLTPTFTSSHDDKFNIITASEEIEEPVKESHMTSLTQQAYLTTNKSIEDPTQTIRAQIKSPPKHEEQKAIQQNEPLPDPTNFSSASTEEHLPATSEVPESFSRLASYFTMPPAQPDHSKSFFELSQSQNHYRHVKPDSKNPDQKAEQNLNLSPLTFDYQTHVNLQNLMQDLTSTHNMKVDDNIVRTVNHFMVEYDNGSIHLDNRNLETTSKNIYLNPLDSSNSNGENNNVIDSSINSNINKEDEDINSVRKCKYCCNKKIIDTKNFKIRTAMNDSESRQRSEGNMNDKDSNEKKKSVTVDLGSYDMDEEAHDGNSVLDERRPSSEYTPVRHHWFYRVDVEDKSVWRGFSVADSNALERAYLSPDLNEDTLVPTDGGRYDVNIIGRLRIAVYWKEKPTNVRRCSWFYKGNTDARYVPYTEAVADKLEEEYRHGVTTGEWHRRLVLPGNELVVMHGPAVMVHFLQGGVADSFSSPPPSTSRPRVVRRGREESEIEDPEPSSIDHLLLLCHGVGSACDMRFRSIEEVVEDFRTTSLQLVQSHYRNSYDSGVVSRVEVLPISWHAQLHVGEDGVDKRLNRVTLDSIPRLRAFTNHTVLDALFYTSPVYHQTIIDTVCFELNRIYSLFRQRNPNFEGGVSLGGHSLGSVILYDLLCNQSPELATQKSSAEKTYLPGTDERVKALKYPQLQFPPAALYALGSPIAIFECIRGVESLGMDFALPTCKNFFNIFHPYDPIAYRIEPLINPLLQDSKPFLIPHHKGRKRMHLELKETMVRVGADLKQKLIESLRTTWNKWKSSPPPDGQLEKVVEEELEKEQLCEETKEDEVNVELTTPEMLGKLNCGRRVDYVLQEAPLEMINEYLFAMSSHVRYWESEDTMLLILREIYSSLGVQPDSTVPQQSMTVQRTRTQRQDEATVVYEKDSPSTSRDSN